MTNHENVAIIAVMLYSILVFSIVLPWIRQCPKRINVNRKGCLLMINCLKVNTIHTFIIKKSMKSIWHFATKL